MGLITELWIIEENGTLLYNQKTTVSVNPILFSGFMSAILLFVKEMGEISVVHIMKLGKFNFVILKEDDNGLIIVGKTEGKVESKKTQKLLKKIIINFSEKYENELKNLNGQVDCFRSFSDDINLETDEDNSIDRFKRLF